MMHEGSGDEPYFDDGVPGQPEIVGPPLPPEYIEAEVDPVDDVEADLAAGPEAPAAETLGQRGLGDVSEATIVTGGVRAAAEEPDLDECGGPLFEIKPGSDTPVTAPSEAREVPVVPPCSRDQPAPAARHELERGKTSASEVDPDDQVADARATEPAAAESPTVIKATSDGDQAKAPDNQPAADDPPGPAGQPGQAGHGGGPGDRGPSHQDTPEDDDDDSRRRRSGLEDQPGAADASYDDVSLKATSETDEPVPDDDLEKNDPRLDDALWRAFDEVRDHEVRSPAPVEDTVDREPKILDVRNVPPVGYVNTGDDVLRQVEIKINSEHVPLSALADSSRPVLCYLPPLMHKYVAHMTANTIRLNEDRHEAGLDGQLVVLFDGDEPPGSYTEAGLFQLVRGDVMISGEAPRIWGVEGLYRSELTKFQYANQQEGEAVESLVMHIGVSSFVKLGDRIQVWRFGGRLDGAGQALTTALDVIVRVGLRQAGKDYRKGLSRGETSATPSKLSSMGTGLRLFGGNRYFSFWPPETDPNPT